MDIRKIQITGGSSFVISLPKEWVKQQNLHKNDSVGLITQTNGTLILTPNLDFNNTPRATDFLIEDYPDSEMFLRSLIGAYIMGSTTIRITSKNRIPEKVRSVVRVFTQMTIGQEVAEETDKVIILSDILNPAVMPFEKSVKRMYIIVKAMHEDAMSALETKDRELANDVLSRDTDVDRLHWLIHRQFSLIITTPSLVRKMNVEPITAASYYQISRIIERVGDHAETISEAAITLIDLNADKALINEIIRVGKVSIALFVRSMKAVDTDNLTEINAIIKAADDAREKYNKLFVMTQKSTGIEAIALTTIINSMHRICEYSSDIAEILINQTVKVMTY